MMVKNTVVTSVYQITNKIYSFDLRRAESYATLAQIPVLFILDR
jgi:hypothetical protein